MKKIFLAENISSVFKGFTSNFLSSEIKFVDDLENADVVAVSTPDSLVKYDEILDKKIPIVFWTNEPRFCSDSRKCYESDGRTILNFNCFTDDVLVDCFQYLWVGSYKSLSSFTQDKLIKKSSSKLVCCLASQHGDGHGFYFKNLDIDLYQKRRRLALALHDSNLCDIVGSGWPEGVAMNFSNEGRGSRGWSDWELEKLNFISNYKFNLAFENTNLENYVTEKFWHPIMAGTLPIYYSGSTNIYKYIPSDSFVDYSLFNDPEEFMCFLKGMSDDEYKERLNKLIERYNEFMSDSSYLRRNREKVARGFEARLLSFF